MHLGGRSGGRWRMGFISRSGRLLVVDTRSRFVLRSLIWWWRLWDSISICLRRLVFGVCLAMSITPFLSSRKVVVGMVFV